MTDTTGGAPQGTPDETGAAGGTSKDEQLWALLAHVSYFVIGIIGPVLVLVLHKNVIGHESAFVRHHAKQALFWQIGAMVIGILTCGIAALVMMIWAVMAAMAASRGELYCYPALSGVTAD